LREKELRIALVCFGGVSLAIYMHGITKEILKLARASSALHAVTDRRKRSSATFLDNHDAADPEYDTETIYFDLLRDIGKTLELRIIVDIVAGASAGGINGVMLARALSHDLPMGRLRELWLKNADVTELLAPEAMASRWSKWFLRPFFWAAGFAGVEPIKELEVRTKLSLFMRSRWFEPPFDGMKMAELMYDAVVAMGTPRERTSSLLPSGQGLDLSNTAAARPAPSKAISTWRMRRHWRSPRARPRRFQESSLPHRYRRWTDSSGCGQRHGRAARNSSHKILSTMRS